VAAALGLALLGEGAASRPATGQPAPGFLAMDGHGWRALAEGEKLALLTGFLIGGTLEQALAGAPGAAPPPPETLDATRRAGQVRFPYAPAVYKARLEDFYFYQDRLAVPLYRALFQINEQLRQGSAPR
jgi:hypothetical protein